MAKKLILVANPTKHNLAYLKFLPCTKFMSFVFSNHQTWFTKPKLKRWNILLVIEIFNVVEYSEITEISNIPETSEVTEFLTALKIFHREIFTRWEISSRYRTLWKCGIFWAIGNFHNFRNFYLERNFFSNFPHLGPPSGRGILSPHSRI